ncbi:hypothetical protein GGF31_002676 [Allomyces arbusculus]|nr:hypothetical protein GGF31_002676 [Allomyces arbusculus]
MAQEKSYDMNVRIASRLLQVVLAALTAAMVQRVDPAALRDANVVSTAIAVIWVTYLSVPTAGILLAYHYLPAVRKKWPLSRVLGVEMGMSLLGTLVHVGMTVGLALATGAVRSPAAGTAMVFASVFATGSAVTWGYSAYRATRDLFWRGRDKGYDGASPSNPPASTQQPAGGDATSATAGTLAGQAGDFVRRMQNYKMTPEEKAIIDRAQVRSRAYSTTGAILGGVGSIVWARTRRVSLIRTFFISSVAVFATSQLGPILSAYQASKELKALPESGLRQIIVDAKNGNYRGPMPLPTQTRSGDDPTGDNTDRPQSVWDALRQQGVQTSAWDRVRTGQASPAPATQTVPPPRHAGPEEQEAPMPVVRSWDMIRNGAGEDHGAVPGSISETLSSPLRPVAGPGRGVRVNKYGDEVMD